MCNDGTYLWIKLNIWVYGWILNFLHKVNFGISVLSRSKDCFSFNVQNKTCFSTYIPFFAYADVVYQNTTKTNLLPLTTAYNKICYWMFIWYTSLYYVWFTLMVSTQYQKLFIFKCIHLNYPNYLRQNLILYSSSYHLRHSANDFFTPLVKKVFGKKTFKGIIYL